MNSLDLPSSPESCLTLLEASFFVARESHSFLKRAPTTIRSHLAQCGPCQLAVSASWKRLRDDQDRVREMLGAPKLPAFEGVLPPICFADSDNEVDSSSKSQSSGSDNAPTTSTTCAPLSPEDLADFETEFDSELKELLGTDDGPSRAKCLSPEPIEVQLNYAERQLTREVEAKKLVARWVVEEIPLRDEASILIDAGSQSYLVWKEMASRLKDAQMSSLSVLTFNQAVANSWFRNEDNAQAFAPNFQLAASHCNASHRAFFGADPSHLQSYHPSVALIGTNGIRVSAGRIYVGFNCGNEELEDKKLLFRLGVTQRVVLLTSSKIGEPGGRAFDLLELPDLDSDAPIYFVTNEPTPGGIHRDALDKALHNMQSDKMRKKLLDRGVSINWIIVRDRDGFAFDIKEFP